jgi:hypothetical protein
MKIEAGQQTLRIERQKKCIARCDGKDADDFASSSGRRERRSLSFGRPMCSLRAHQGAS